MIFSECLQRPSESFGPDQLGTLYLMNMPLEERVALGVAKARLRRGGPRERAFNEVRRLETFGESIYAPRGYLFTVESRDGVLELSDIGRTSHHELGYSLEFVKVSAKPGEEPIIFLADRIVANPKASQLPGKSFAYSPYHPYQRVKLDSDKYLVDLIPEDDIPRTAFNVEPDKRNWLRYSNPWEDC